MSVYDCDFPGISQKLGCFAVQSKPSDVSTMASAPCFTDAHFLSSAPLTQTSPVIEIVWKNLFSADFIFGVTFRSFNPTSLHAATASSYDEGLAD